MPITRVQSRSLTMPARGHVGPRGAKPNHEWGGVFGTSLRFQNPDDTWGAFTDLRGQGIQPNAVGDLEDRDAYDGEDQGFIFLALDVTPLSIYVKASNASGDWVGPIANVAPVPWVNVDDFGAVGLDDDTGDIVADDTAAFEAAEAALPEKGGIIFAPDKYAINWTPTKNGVHLWMPYSAQIQNGFSQSGLHAYNKDQPILTLSGGIQGFVGNNIEFADWRGDDEDEANYGVLVSGATYALFEHCTWRQLHGYAIKFDNSGGAPITRIRVNNFLIIPGEQTASDTGGIGVLVDMTSGASIGSTNFIAANHFSNGSFVGVTNSRWAIDVFGHATSDPGNPLIDFTTVYIDGSYNFSMSELSSDARPCLRMTNKAIIAGNNFTLDGFGERAVFYTRTDTPIQRAIWGLGMPNGVTVQGRMVDASGNVTSVNEPVTRGSHRVHELFVGKRIRCLNDVGALVTNYAGGSAQNSGADILAGFGNPEGVETAPKGSLYLRLDGGSGTCLYVKESSASNTGWTAK